MAFVLLPCDLPTWPTVQRHLTQLRLSKNSQQLTETLFKIYSLCSVGLDPDDGDPGTIQIFDKLKAFIDHGMSQIEKHRLFDVVIPTIVDYAQKLKMYKPTSGLHYSLQQQADSVDLDRRFILSLLACSFVSCFPKRTNKTHPTLQDFNFITFFEFLDCSSQRAKLRTLFRHFEKASDRDPTGKVKVQRLVASTEDLCSKSDWVSCHKPLCPVIVHPQGLLEDANHDMCRVCFLSSKVGGQTLRNGYNQEACQFITHPELLSTMCFVEDLDNNEAILVEGYSLDFYLRDLKTNPSTIDLQDSPEVKVTFCALDADDFSDFPLEQYEDESLLRELNKALLGFHQPNHAACLKQEIPEEVDSIFKRSISCPTGNMLTTKNGSIELESEDFSGHYLDPLTLKAFGIGGLSTHLKGLSPNMGLMSRFSPDSAYGVILEGHESRASEEESHTDGDAYDSSSNEQPVVPSFMRKFPNLSESDESIKLSCMGGNIQLMASDKENVDIFEDKSAVMSRSDRSSSVCSVGSDELIISSDGAESGDERSEPFEHMSFGADRSPVSPTSSIDPSTLRLPMEVTLTASSLSIPSLCPVRRKTSQETHGDDLSSMSDSDSPPKPSQIRPKTTSFGRVKPLFTKYAPDPDKLSPMPRNRWFCIGTDSDSESILYASCRSENTSDDEYFSAQEVSDKMCATNASDNIVSRQEFASRLFEALELARHNSGDSALEFTDSVTTEDPRIKSRGSAGFYLDSFEGSFDEDGNPVLDAKSLSNLSFSRNESSKYSFSSDFNSELEDLYEQFNHWLNTSKDEESRVIAVSKFANNLLKRGLSDTYANIAMAIESLCDNPKTSEVMKRTPHIYSEVIRKFSRSLSLTEKLSIERDALQRAKDNVRLKKEISESNIHSGSLSDKTCSDVWSKKIDLKTSIEGIRPIATGNWGCGKYAGDVQLKAIIQWLAASMAGVPCMVYYTCSNPGMKHLELLAKGLVGKEWSVGSLAAALFNYTEKLLQENRKEIEEKYNNRDDCFESDQSFLSSFSVKMDKCLIDHLLELCFVTSDTQL